MIGGKQTPFRLPCGTDGTPKYFLGLPSHRHAAPVAAYGNTTTMVDHCGNTIPATLRYQQVQTCGTDICSPNCNDCPGGTNLVTNTPNPPAIADNTWSAATGTVQLEPTNKLGWKLAQAFKAWHGRYGFVTTCDGTKSNTKYRTVTASFTLKTYDNGPGVDDNYTEDTGACTVTVDKFGNVTVSGCTSIHRYVDVTTTPPTYDTAPGGLDTDIIELMMGGCITGIIATIKGEIDAGDPHYASGSATVTETSFHFDYVPSNHGDNSEFTGDLTLSDAYTINDVLADAATLAAEWVLTNDLVYPYRTDAHTTVGPLVIYDENATPIAPLLDFTCTTSTSDYTGDIIGSPLNAGYGQPVGGNPRGVFDRDHPNWFRRNCVSGVGWTQGNESLGAFTPDYLPSNAQKWTDDFQATSLFPTAFINADEDGVYLQKWVETKIPRPSINFARPYGPDKFLIDETTGFVFYVSDFTSGVVTLLNTDFSTPSSLPFTTADIVGSTAVDGFFAVTSISGNTVTLGTKIYDLPTDWNTPSGDGGQCFGKLRFPDAPGMDFLDQTIGVGGRVTVSVVDSGSVRTLTTATVQKYLSITSTENIDILAADNTVLASGVAATRVDDTHFTVPTAYATIATAAWIVPSLLNDGSTTGQKYKFADNRPKGDYVYRTWLVRSSDSTVLATSQTDACLKFSPCGPSFAGITPNGESSTTGHFWAMPTTINNGEVWIGQIQFWMVDPFWQQPHTPVGGFSDTFDPGVDQVIWLEDDGTCNPQISTSTGGGGETIYTLFYPMRPYVEARCTLPTNIDGETPPALASGVDLTAVAPVPDQAHIGDAEGPLVDAIVLPAPAWVTYLNQKGCVVGGGDFATDYQANGTTA